MAIPHEETASELAFPGPRKNARPSGPNVAAA
jgi:hypothetical protein